VNAESEQELQAQFERLQETLSSRQSTLHFAHAGVSTIVALLLGGAAAKLFWDSLRTPKLAFFVTAVSVGLVVYAFVHFRKARRLLADELKQYGDLLELRRRLRLDDPSALLPR
jgi:RsiW-degrading membrane proteinase PrsW (M82 family)